MAISDTYYVTMTDKFFTGWGEAEGRIAKLIVICDTLSQAEGIFRAAHDRKEMKAIHYTGRKPRYSPSKYKVSVRHVSALGDTWIKHIPESDRPK
jgi:hypothetical protein